MSLPEPSTTSINWFLFFIVSPLPSWSITTTLLRSPTSLKKKHRLALRRSKGVPYSFRKLKSTLLSFNLALYSSTHSFIWIHFCRLFLPFLLWLQSKDNLGDALAWSMISIQLVFFFSDWIIVMLTFVTINSKFSYFLVPIVNQLKYCSCRDSILEFLS